MIQTTTEAPQELLAAMRAVDDAVSEAFLATPTEFKPPRETPLQRYRQSRIAALAAGVEWLLTRAECPELRAMATSCRVLAGEACLVGDDAAELRRAAEGILADLECMRSGAVLWLQEQLGTADDKQAHNLLKMLLELGELGIVEDALGQWEGDPFVAEHLRIGILTACGRTYEAAWEAERCYERYPTKSLEASLERSLQYRRPGGAIAESQFDAIETSGQLMAALLALLQVNNLPKAVVLAATHHELLRRALPIAMVALRIVAPVAATYALPLSQIRKVADRLPPHYCLVVSMQLDPLLPTRLAELIARSAAEPGLHPYATGVLNEALNQATERLPRALESQKAQAEVLAMCGNIRGGVQGSGMPEKQLQALAASACYREALDAGGEAIGAMTTLRAREFFEAVKTADTGAMLFGNHLPEKAGGIDFLGTHAAAALSGREVLGVLQSNSRHHCAQARRNSRGPMGGREQPLLDIFGMDNERQATAILDHLKAGGVLDVTNDGLKAPGVRSLVPWFERPYALRSFPAQAALATGAKMGLRLISTNGSRPPVLDVIEVVPPHQGSLRVKSIWFTQRIAKQMRVAHAKGLLDCGTDQIRMFGGIALERNLIGIEEWRSLPAVRSSLLAALQAPFEPSSPRPVPEGGRLISSETTAEPALRMAAMLLHFQKNALGHGRSDRRFLDQHRVAVIAPRGELMIASAFGALAAGSLMCPLEDDLSPTALRMRLEAFRPDLILAPALVWSAVLNEDRELQKAPVLIFDDAGDLAAAEDLLESFDPAEALPAFEPRQPGYVVFTSGSEGLPKGVVVPAGVLAGPSGLDRCIEVTAQDRILYMTRWDAVGLTDLMACLRGRAKLVLPDRATERSPVALAQWIEEARVTFLSAPVSIWRLLLKTPHWQIGEDTSLRQGMLWGEPITRRVMTDLARTRPGLKAWCIYDSSEVTYTALGPLPEAAWTEMTGSPGGWPVPETEIEIRDPESPDLSPLSVVSSNAMLGYFDALANSNRPVALEDRREALLQDILRRDERGRIEVLGRKDAVFKLAGRRFSIRQFEMACEQIEGVTAAIGVLDLSVEIPELSMALQAPESRAQEVADLARYAVFEASGGALKLKLVKSFPEFPVMASGKTDRGHIRQTLSAGLPAQVASIDTPMIPQLPPLLDRLRRWAKEVGLCKPQYFDPLAEMPQLTSLETLELALVIEEVQDGGDGLELPSTRQTWASFAEALSYPAKSQGKLDRIEAVD